MFVEAFSFVNSNSLGHFHVSPFVPPHHELRHRIIPALTRKQSSSALLATTSSDATYSTETPTVDISYDKESRHHIITIPPFLSSDKGNQDYSYPSLLHKIHILPLLTPDETSHVLNLARNYANENQSWNQQDSSRHVTYPTVDFAIEESIEISHYLGNKGIQFQDRIFGALSEAYDVDVEDMSFLDLFCASYEAAADDDVDDDDVGDAIDDEEDEERGTMDRLEFHRDGSLLSFTVLLSPPEEYEGGGTIFDALRDVHIDDDASSVLQSPGSVTPSNAGFATLHSGKLLHGGHVITKGQRIVLVGFVNVEERNIRPGVLGDATKEWGRNDVRMFWNQRRLSLLKQQHQQKEGEEGEQFQPVWKIKNWRYLSKDSSNEGRSYFGPETTVPFKVLDNMERRANLEVIRKRRLITEDELLRGMLLPREERGEKLSMEEGQLREVELDMDGLVLGWEGDEDDSEDEE